MPSLPRVGGVEALKMGELITELMGHLTVVNSARQHTAQIDARDKSLNVIRGLELELRSLKRTLQGLGPS
jgi:hypothetical protein